MPIDFLNMLSQFEQLDNQKEQLVLQRQEQASRNVAQAVGTLVTIAPEARAGYLQQMQQATGMDYGFLQALAVNTPTPQSILVARGFERAMESGDVSDVSLAANVLGMTPIAFQTQQQVSEYQKTGKVPDMIKRLPQELQAQALMNLVTASAGLPDVTQLDLQANPLLNRGERQQAARVGADIAVGAKTRATEAGENSRNSARVGAQYAGIASNERQGNKDRDLRRDQGLMQNSTQIYTSELGARVNMAQAGASAARGGSGGRGGAADGVRDPLTGLTLKELMDNKQFLLKNGGDANAARNGMAGLLRNDADETYNTGNQTEYQLNEEALQRVRQSLMTPQASAPITNTMGTPAFAPTTGFNMFGGGLGPAGLLNSMVRK